MRSRRPLGRRGFTLTELITSLALLGVIGLAFVRLVVSQARFTEGQMALRNARTVSRNAMNIMLTDIRMVQDNGGLYLASRDSVSLRVPVAFGLLCVSSGASATMQILPVDSALTAMGHFAGWAFRDSVSGLFKYEDNNNNSVVPFNSIPAGTTTICTDSTVVLGVQRPGILPMSYTAGTTVRSSKVIQVHGHLSVGQPNAGWPIFLYQHIVYRFQPSTAYPGRIGLFRKVRVSTNDWILDEIIAPFDSSAKFRFYVENSDVAQAAVPVDLNTVRGLELVLAGSSPRAQQGKKSAEQALVTGVFFKNRRDP